MKRAKQKGLFLHDMNFSILFDKTAEDNSVIDTTPSSSLLLVLLMLNQLIIFRAKIDDDSKIQFPK
jgi:hypothetical protein